MDDRNFRGPLARLPSCKFKPARCTIPAQVRINTHGSSCDTCQRRALIESVGSMTFLFLFRLNFPPLGPDLRLEVGLVFLDPGRKPLARRNAVGAAGVDANRRSRDRVFEQHFTLRAKRREWLIILKPLVHIVVGLHSAIMTTHSVANVLVFWQISSAVGHVVIQSLIVVASCFVRNLFRIVF